MVLVSGGVVQVPSSLKYFEVPAVVLGAGTRPDLAPEPDFPNTEYVVSEPGMPKAVISALATAVVALT